MNIEERKKEGLIQETMHMFCAGAKQVALVLDDGAIIVAFEDEYEDLLKEVGEHTTNVIRIA